MVNKVFCCGNNYFLRQRLNVNCLTYDEEEGTDAEVWIWVIRSSGLCGT